MEVIGVLGIVLPRNCNQNIPNLTINKQHQHLLEILHMEQTVLKVTEQDYCVNLDFLFPFAYKYMPSTISL